MDMIEHNTQITTLVDEYTFVRAFATYVTIECMQVSNRTIESMHRV